MEDVDSNQGFKYVETCCPQRIDKTSVVLHDNNLYLFSLACFSMFFFASELTRCHKILHSFSPWPMRPPSIPPLQPPPDGTEVNLSSFEMKNEITLVPRTTNAFFPSLPPLISF